MPNGSCIFDALNLQQFGLEVPIESISLLQIISYHGQPFMPSSSKEEALMFLSHVSIVLSLFLLIIHLLSFLLVKLFAFLLHRATYKANKNVQLATPKDEEHKETADECRYENEDLLSEIFGGEEGLFFFYSENAVEDTLLVAERIDNSELTPPEAKNCFVSDDTPLRSPGENIEEEKLGGKSDDVSSRIILKSKNITFEDVDPSYFDKNEREKHSLKDDKFFVIDHSQIDSNRVDTLEDDNEEKETLGGSLTCESTSKSSMEWRCSTIFRDSETEYPFSSSSRRSSSNWETFALFRKYDEEMMFFDQISAQKLTETESFRSFKHQPRSISQRISKFVTKNKKVVRNPYQDLEGAYVAQVCLAWDALNWNYKNFKKKITGGEREDSCCPARIAQQFQQFQVLLQRFIENEPYEHGRRPEVFARIRKVSPKLLQVPEYRDSEDDESKEEMISLTEFKVILEDGMSTFLNFLKADKENPCQKIKAIVKRKSSIVDPNLLYVLRKENKKKKKRLKHLVRSRTCLRKRKLKKEEEMEIIMGLIDMKVVSRVLRMAGISQEQFHWCEEKMAKVRVSDGKIQRDSSPLFFPVQ